MKFLYRRLCLAQIGRGAFGMRPPSSSHVASEALELTSIGLPEVDDDVEAVLADLTQLCEMGHVQRPFNVLAYVEVMEKALKEGDKLDIVRVICSITNENRQLLKEAYRAKYGVDLKKQLDKKFSSDLANLVFALMETSVKYDAKQLKKSTKGLGTDDDAIIEIICTRPASRLLDVAVAFEKKYGEKLEDDISDDTSGEYRDVLVALINGVRNESPVVDEEEAEEDASSLLFATGKMTALTPLDGFERFTPILTTRGWNQIAEIVKAYERLSGGRLEDDVSRVFSGELRKVYLAIVTFATDKARFFAEQLYKSMKGLGTDDNRLIRLIVSRSEIDLPAIRAKFDETYKETLVEMIKGDTSGGYREALLMIVNGKMA